MDVGGGFVFWYFEECELVVSKGNCRGIDILNHYLKPLKTPMKMEFKL
jgi:hypothetical protein